MIISLCLSILCTDHIIFSLTNINSFSLSVPSGMGSGSLAVCLGTPFDVALVRMQADSMKAKGERRGYKNVFDALSRVAKEEGFRKLYRYFQPKYLFEIDS